MKVKKYADLVPRFIFTPVAFEMMGCGGEASREFVDELCRMMVA